MSPQKDETAACSTEDYASRPLSFLVGWGIPILAIVALNFVRPAPTVATAVIMAAFAWMGIGCLINAKRCRRRHCFYSGPIFLIGAVVSGLVGFAVIDLGRDGMLYTLWGTLAAVGLTFVPEFIWGKYRD